ncbi:O-antigen ligase family protein [Cereibacter sphaeroides]|uniref:O-antigen ligase family protein n=1 Tax=Cereibacter sphaeroides TaxID=1063 RepID=UPI000191CC66|nr:O-antigen ligase family protein [Cereibacter sphaeroides]ACM04025.1 O-antigen polymerase [Cereibacter sphaeroides KD131]GEM94184.1 hypothetical protein RSP03_32510 [Cereibacter sphaeroides]
MTGDALGKPLGLQVEWRTLEIVAVLLALMIQTGAVSVLLLESDGGLGSGPRMILRAMALPGYAVTLVILARYYVPFLALLRQNLPMALFLVLPFLSAFWSIGPSVTLRRAIAIFFSILMCYVLAIRFTPRQFLVLSTLVIAATLILSLLAIVALPGLAFMPQGPELRGVFVHKNVLGWYAAFGLLLSAALGADRTLGLRPFAISVFVAALVCLLLSQSGTALITAALAVAFTVFYALLRRARPLGRSFLTLLVLQSTVLFAISVNSFVPALLEGMGKDATLTGRVPLWDLVDQAILRRPVLGYGYQAFWSEGSGEAWVIWTKLVWMAPHAHNGYRDTLLSLGLVGLALLVVVIVRALRQGAALLSREPSEPWLVLNVLVAVFLVMNMTESLLLQQNNFLFILFVTAALMFSRRETPT